MSALRNAAWWLLDYAYAMRWQTRASFNRTDAASFQTGERIPLVIVPGIYETWKFMQPIIEAAHGRGHPVHVITELGRNRRPVITAADHVCRYIEAHELDDIVLVAHSKGGLVGKLVMTDPRTAERVRGMVAVATPFGGSRYGRLLPAPSLRAFSPSDATIRALNRSVESNARIVSVYARFDPHIPEGSELGGARNVLVDTGGHFRVLAHPRVMSEIARMTGNASLSVGE